MDNFLAAEEQAIELIQNGQTAINATGLTAQDVRDGALDELLENPEAFLESAPILIGAPIDVQQSFATRAQSKIAEARGFEIGNFEAVTLDLDALDAQALAEATQQEIENLRAEGIFAVDGTNLTVDDVLAGNLDETIGVSSALVNASDEVFAAYEARLSEKLAEEAGISIEELNFVNQAVQAAGVTSAEEAGRVAAQVAARFNEENNLTELVLARQAANQAENLAKVAEELQQVANEAGTQEALRAAEEAVQAAESAKLRPQGLRAKQPQLLAAPPHVQLRKLHGRPHHSKLMSKPYPLLELPDAPLRKPRQRQHKQRPQQAKRLILRPRRQRAAQLKKPRHLLLLKPLNKPLCET